MGVGKYSPTVSRSYAADRNWFEKNGGGTDNGIDPTSYNDDDGYDAYGYSGRLGEGPDRAGYTENDYMTSYHVLDDGDIQYSLYETISDEYSGINLLTLRENKKELAKDPVFKKELELQRELKAIIEEAQAKLAPIEKSINHKLNVQNH